MTSDQLIGIISILLTIVFGILSLREKPQTKSFTL